MVLYCPFCKSKKPLWKAGIRKELNGSKKQQYKCQKCHRQTVKPRKEK
jgi:transposase-like protein